MQKKSEILMIGPAPGGRGGMASVIDVYFTQGLFETWPMRFLPTHKEGGRWLKLWTGVYAFCAVLVGLARHRVLALHIHVAQRTSFFRKAIFALLAAALRTPYLFHMHGSEFREFYAGGSVFTRVLVRWVLRHARAVISLSGSWRTWVLSIEPAARVVVIHNPIAVASAAVDFPPQGGESTILFLGRLGQRKGIYDLLQALVQVQKRVPGVKLVCGGDGELDEVRAKAAALGIADNVAVVGWITGEAKQKLMKEAAVYVLPSYNEGLPMAILEAMAAGIPVVASDVGGIPDAIDDGIDGFLVPAGNIELLCSRLEGLLMDAELRHKIGRNGQLKAQRKFAAAVVFEHLGELYREIGCVPHNAATRSTVSQ
jgi:glycosyltransferase involved in cell wall biosynthesis